MLGLDGRRWRSQGPAVHLQQNQQVSAEGSASRQWSHVFVAPRWSCGATRWTALLKLVTIRVRMRSYLVVAVADVNFEVILRDSEARPAVPDSDVRLSDCRQRLWSSNAGFATVLSLVELS